jgi:acetoin utilization deacetylase AcuC-like enzyme
MPIVSHPDFAHLHPTGQHPERPERLASLLAAFPESVEARSATVEEICAVHERRYVEAIEAASASGRTGYLDADTICTPSSYGLALLAAGAAIEAVEREGFALARPPGHHALAARAMGFCLFNSIAIAARYAQRELGVGRVAILDWDVHHGNGTQEAFRDDPSVLFVSLHRWPFYPGSGGPGDGDATTINIPLEAGSGDDVYAEAMERVAAPAIDAFEPELLLVSSGFDAAAGDPLGGMQLTAAGFGRLARSARGLCARRAYVLEGGYNVATLPALVGAVLESE